MADTPSQAELKARLQELIITSQALESLPEDEQKKRINLMLSADPKTMQKFIKVLEDEEARLAKIDKDFEEDAKQIQDLLIQAKELEKAAEREISHEEEVVERKKDEKKAESLLEKLDEIHEESKGD